MSKCKCDVNDYYELVGEFHDAFGLPLNTTPKLPDQKERDLRIKILVEEYEEYLEAEKENDLVEIADALADMAYIICGTAHSYGIPLNEIFKEVHRTNMAKLGPDGTPIRREDGKVIKPAGWSPPDIDGILRKYNV